MLTSDEKHSLSDQEGPLNGVLLFDSVFQNDLELADAFVTFCSIHRPAIFIDWTHSPDQTVSNLERETSDFGETIDVFLNWLPEEMGVRAVHAIKAALDTLHIPIRRPSVTSLQRENIRDVQTLIDRLWRDQTTTKVSKGAVEALRFALRRFSSPPVEAPQFEALMSKIEGLLKQDQIPSKDFHPVLYFLRFNFPHHEPLLKDFQRWVEDPNRTPIEISEVTRAQWLERLKTMEGPDRETAASVLERVLNAPEHRASCEALVMALRLRG